MQNIYNVNVSYASPVPVEFEGRRIPKTGYYKNEPFAGSADERAGYTAEFRYHLRAKGVKVIKPPTSWYAMDREEYAKKHMELSSSVHIGPDFYRRNNWGQL